MNDTSQPSPQDTQDRFLELRAEGLSYDRIARELHVSKHTLVAWGRQYKDLLDQMRTLHLESVAESYALLKRQRIETLGTQLQRIREELATRDLKDLPTPKLLDMQLKYSMVVQQEIGDLDSGNESQTAGKTKGKMGSKITGLGLRTESAPELDEFFTKLDPNNPEKTLQQFDDEWKTARQGLEMYMQSLRNPDQPPPALT